jgi:hypothetical protein
MKPFVRSFGGMAAITAVLSVALVMAGVTGRMILVGEDTRQAVAQAVGPVSTPAPTAIPGESTPIPLPSGPLPPTPPPPPREGPVEITRHVLTTMVPPSAKRQLTADIIAYRSHPPHLGVIWVVLYHLPTGTYVILNENGDEIQRRERDAQAARVLEGVLNNATLKATALELAR